MNYFLKSLITSYVIAIPMATTLIFTYLAIVRHGVMSLDMTKYGEYEIEISMLLLWYVLLIYKLKSLKVF